MEVRLPCECGQQTPVTDGQAGMKLMCRCGRMFSVPSLTELKRMSGRGTSISPGLLIETMAANGELPATNDCAACGAETEAVVDVVAICERATIARDDLMTQILLIMFCGWFIWLLFYLNRRARTEGVDREVRMPLRICPHCQTVRLKHFPVWPFIVLALLVAAVGVAIGLYVENVIIPIMAAAAAVIVSTGSVMWSRSRFSNQVRHLLRCEPAYIRLMERYPNAQFMILGRETSTHDAV